jgi:hypothetical protein
MKRLLRHVLIAAGVLVGGGTLLAAGLVAALPVIAESMPLELSRTVLTDGKRQVEMQGMAHLGEPRFYKEIADLVAERRAAGWLVFYEEVRPDIDDPKAGLADVLNRLGAEWNPSDSRHPYEIMGGLLGDDLMLQNNREMLGPPGPDVRNVDVTLSQLLASLPPESEGAGKDIDLSEIRRLFDEAPGWVQSRIRAAIRIALSVSSSGDLARDQLPPALTTQREELVVKAILDEPDRNILVLYGQAHISGFRRKLDAANPDWRLVSENTIRAF